MSRLLLAFGGAFLLALLAPAGASADATGLRGAASAHTLASCGKTRRGKARKGKEANGKRGERSRKAKKPREPSDAPAAPSRPKEARGLKL
jgi:hypothetical protein